MIGFRSERVVASPARFHALDLIGSLRVPAVVVSEPTVAAVVLGSAQSLAVVDDERAAAAGVEVVRRRSGGGAVLVRPGEMTWFDVVVPAAAALVPVDVTASMRWLGGSLVDALERVGVPGAVVHAGPMHTTAWSRLVCFDGVAPGEVVLAGPDDGLPAKLVGISQRRTRDGARFQCIVHHRWAPAALLDLLRDPKPLVDELAPVATVAADVATALPAALAAVLSA